MSELPGSVGNSQEHIDYVRSHPRNHCFACSSKEVGSWNLKLTNENDCVTAPMWVPKCFQGYEGVVHGGVAATFLDEVMGYAVLANEGKHAITQRLKLTYLRPVMVEKAYQVTARVINKLDGACSVSGEIVDDVGTIHVSGVALFKCTADPFMLAPQEITTHSEK